MKTHIRKRDWSTFNKRHKSYINSVYRNCMSGEKISTEPGSVSSNISSYVFSRPSPSIWTYIVFAAPGEGPLQCTSCPPRYMLEGGLCMECLGSQFYDPPTQLCKTCHDSCRSCSGPGPFSCLGCLFPLHLDTLNNQCAPCCTALQNDTLGCCHCDKATGTENYSRF